MSNGVNGTRFGRQDPQYSAKCVPLVTTILEYRISIAALDRSACDEAVRCDGDALTTGNFNVTGGLFGPTLGANFQYDAFVFGLEGDFDASWIKGSDTACPGAAACQTHNDWLVTARGRVGYAADRVLFYATAGGAFGDVRANVNTTWQHQNKAGWTAGAGIEAAFADNWTARVEYLFVDLQNTTFNTTSFGPPVTVKFDASLVRLGVIYKFR